MATNVPGLGALLRPLAASLPALVLTAACDDDGGSSPPELTPPPRVEPVATFAPANAPSPPVVDTIRAVASGDLEALLSRFSLSAVACSPDMWPLPGCGPGEEVGAESPRLPFIGCEPAFLTEPELRFVLKQVVLDRSPSLFALVQSGNADPTFTWFPVGPTAVILATSPPEGTARPTGVILVLDKLGRVVSLRTHCRASPDELLETVYSELEVVLPAP